MPSAAVPPTAVIPTGSALMVDVPAGSTLGTRPASRGDNDALLCRARGTAATAAVLVGRRPGFVRVVVAAAAGPQRAVNVQVTV